MSPRPLAAAAVWALACAASAVSASVAVVDDRGHAVSLPHPAARIVTLAPGLTELAFAAGAGGRLVAVARFSNHPPEAARLPLVGDASLVSLERIAELRPDLVLAWKTGNRPADIERIEAMGFPVLVVEPARLGDIPRVLRTIGTLAGTGPAAESAALRFEARRRALEARAAGRPPVPVFFQLWHAPPMTVSGAQLISDVLRLCGGANVFEHAPGLTPAVSWEAIVAAGPRVVVASRYDPALEADVRAAWARLGPVAANRPGAITFVEADLIERATPRVLDGAEEVCAAIERARR